MFIQLHSISDQEQHLCNPYTLKEMVLCAPVILIIILKVSIHYTSLSAMFNPLHSSAKQELSEKLLCNQNSHYEKYGRFLLQRETITAEWLSKVCYDVAIEPPLQPLTGE